MIELVISACLVTVPWECKDFKETFIEEFLTPMKCVMHAQPELAKWKEEHPGWEITKYRCQRSFHHDEAKI